MPEFRKWREQRENNPHPSGLLPGAVSVYTSRHRGYGAARHPSFPESREYEWNHFVMPKDFDYDELLRKPRLFQKTDPRTGWRHFAVYRNTDSNGLPLQDRVGRNGNYILSATQFPPDHQTDIQHIGHSLLNLPSPEHHGEYEDMKISGIKKETNKVIEVHHYIHMVKD